MINDSHFKKIFDWDFIKKEEEANSSSFCFCGGTDEVGRGPLAGPVVACTVLVARNSNRNLLKFLQHIKSAGVSDSKLLTAVRRKDILQRVGIDSNQIKPHQVFSFNKFPFACFALASVSNREIDRINILKASLKSMEISFLHCLKENIREEKKTLLLIDGKYSIPGLEKFNSEILTQRPIVKGDLKSALIGLASIIAKDYRDMYMQKMSKKYPGHGWEKNFGYPTARHRESIKKIGITPLHRKSFSGVKEYRNL